MWQIWIETRQHPNVIPLKLLKNRLSLNVIYHLTCHSGTSFMYNGTTSQQLLWYIRWWSASCDDRRLSQWKWMSHTYIKWGRNQKLPTKVDDGLFVFFPSPLNLSLLTMCVSKAINTFFAYSGIKYLYCEPRGGIVSKLRFIYLFYLFSHVLLGTLCQYWVLFSPGVPALT